MARRRPFVAIAVKPPESARNYNFNGGINTLTANEQLPPAVSPFLRNKRYKSRETIITRRGPGFYTVPIGEALGAVKTTAATNDRTVSLTLKQAAKFVASASQPLTMVQLNLKNTAAGAGPLIVEIWTDSSGSPGTRLASSSITSGLITSSYQYLSARFIAAPTLVSGTSYWIVAYIQADGLNSYLWSSLAGSATSKTSPNNGAWTSSVYDLNFKTYQSPANPIIGGERFIKSDGTEITLLATKNGVYSVNDLTGATAQVYAGDTSATHYKFAIVNDTAYWINGKNAPQQWNGIAATSSNAAGSPPIADDIRVHKNRIFYLSALDRTRVVFTEPGSFDTILSVNFLYIPAPLSPDYVQQMTSLQDNLLFRTLTTKWALYGSDLSSFVLRRSTGLQGAAGRDVVASHDNYEYSVANSGIYQFNGATDNLISEAIQPDFEAILDRDLMSMVISGNYLRVFYPIAGEAMNTHAFVYDLQFHIWFIDDQSYFSKAFTYVDNGMEKLVLGSSLVAQAFFADQGYSDLGANINDRYWTKYEAYKTPEELKLMRRFFPKFIGQAGNYNCEIWVDFNRTNTPALISAVDMQLSGAHLGIDFILGTSNLGGNGNPEPELEVEGEFRERQYRFEHNGVDQPVEIYGYTDYFIRERSL